MDKRTQFHVWYIVAAIIGILLLQQLWTQSQQVSVLPYSQFLDDLKGGKIAEVSVSGDYIEGSYKQPENGRQRFVTTRVAPDIAKELQQYNVKFSGSVQSNLLSNILSWVLPTLLFFGVWFFVFRRFASQQGLGGGFMAVGRSKAKVYVETDTKVTFDDVAGVDEAKAELKEVVDFLKNPGEYGRLGARPPKGILLVGPPGTGKTLLARAVAGEAGVPFFSINGSEFVEMFVGVGAARVRDLFAQAREKAPAIIFIDELDALGRARGAFASGGRALAGLGEQVAHPRGAHADEHLDEARPGHREERHRGFPGHGPGQQGLAGARRADHQHAARRHRAGPLVPARIAQEVDDLADLLLRARVAGHIGELGARPLGVEHLGTRPADAHRALEGAGRAP